MVILGIDPGTATTGYGIIKREGSSYNLIVYGVIKTPADLPLTARLYIIYEELTKLIKIYQPDVCAIEELFFNKNTRTALSVGQARGVALLTVALAGLSLSEYTPLQVKQAVAGYGRADKYQIQSMVKLLLNMKETPKPDDAADALAIALCHGQVSKSRHEIKYVSIFGGQRK